MPSAEGPLLHRRRLGTELRLLRGDSTLDDVAEATLISTSKLSRLENGQGVPQARDIRDLIAHYKVDSGTADKLRRWASAGRGQAWWREFSDVLFANLDTYLEYESRASTMRIFAPSVIPGLLQTATYAIELLRGVPPAKSDEQIRRLVEIRERRQTIIMNSDSAARLIIVLDEAVLRRQIGSAEEMVEQLDRLHTLSRKKNVSLLIIPFTAGVHAGLLGAFTVLQYADDIDRDIVAVESHTGERFLEQQSNVLEYLRMFDAISHKALDHDESDLRSSPRRMHNDLVRPLPQELVLGERQLRGGLPPPGRYDRRKGLQGHFGPGTSLHPRRMDGLPGGRS